MRQYGLSKYKRSEKLSNSVTSKMSRTEYESVRNKWWRSRSSFALIFVVVSLVNLRYAEGNKETSRICTSNECLRAAANLKLSMDLDVNPCDNFYKYACGKWTDSHPNVKLDTTYDAYDSIDDKISVATAKILLEKVGDDEPTAIPMSRIFYSSCMDMDTRNTLGVTAMYNTLRKVRLPVLPHYITLKESDRKNFTFNWMKSEALIKKYFGMDVFIGTSIREYSYNVTQGILLIGPNSDGSSSLSSPNYPEDGSGETNNEEKNEESENKQGSEEGSKKQSRKWIAKSNIIKYILSQVTINETGNAPDDYVLQNAVDIIKEVEDALEQINANYTPANEQMQDPPPIPLKLIQFYTDDYLSTPLPNFWTKYFKYMFTGTRIRVRPEKFMVHITPRELEYLNRMLEYLTNTPDINIELYIWWVTVEKMLLSLSSDVIYYVTQQTGDSYQLNAGFDRTCITQVKKYMGYAITYALAEELYPNTTKSKVGKMLRRLKTAFEEQVKNLDWMDNATKKVTLEKSREMISFIGYPDWLFKKGALDRYYYGLRFDSSTYLDNLVNRISHYNSGILNSVNEKQRRSWHNDAFDESEPISANAFYSPKDNAIDIPMGILSFPMYDLGLEVLNYGALLTTLGHELTHGFDNKGRLRDKYGNFRQWWSNSTTEEFSEKVKCFVEQINNFTIEGVNGKVDGERTLSENVADNGGLNQAFAAYKSFQKSNPNEPKLPGFEDVSDDKLFFIAYANTWCKTTDAAAEELALKSGSHAPFSVRLLGSLQNSEDFSRVFNCPVGSFMNPEEKCKIW